MRLTAVAGRLAGAWPGEAWFTRLELATGAPVIPITCDVLLGNPSSREETCPALASSARGHQQSVHRVAWIERASGPARPSSSAAPRRGRDNAAAVRRRGLRVRSRGTAPEHKRPRRGARAGLGAPPVPAAAARGGRRRPRRGVRAADPRRRRAEDVGRRRRVRARLGQNGGDRRRDRGRRRARDRRGDLLPRCRDPLFGQQEPDQERRAQGRRRRYCGRVYQRFLRARHRAGATFPCVLRTRACPNATVS